MNRASAPVRMWEILDPWVVNIKIVIPSEVEGSLDISGESIAS